MRHVVVHIDSLVLRGFPYEHRHAVAEGLHAKLRRRMADGGALGRLSGPGHVSRLSLGRVSVKPDATPRQVGVAVACTIGKATKP